MAKARYLEALFEKTTGEPRQRYISVAREIGSQSNTVRRNLDALAAYKGIEQRDFYDIADVTEENFQFGTFYTAIGNVDVSNFIGTKEEGEPTHPILNHAVIKQDRLEELVKYMFEKGAQGNTRLGESRNISKLGSVLANPASLNAFRAGRSLETAYRLTPHVREDFIRHMNQAIEELKQANANLYAVDQEDRIARGTVAEALKIIQLTAERLGVVPDA